MSTGTTGGVAHTTHLERFIVIYLLRRLDLSLAYSSLLPFIHISHITQLLAYIPWPSQTPVSYLEKLA